MTIRQAAAILAAISLAVLALGLAMGFRPITDGRGYACGSAFRENPDLLPSQLADAMLGGAGVSSCPQRRQDAQATPIMLLALGAVGLLGAGAAVWVDAKREGADRARTQE
jgi:hypothetical protein